MGLRLAARAHRRRRDREAQLARGGRALDCLSARRALAEQTLADLLQNQQKAVRLADIDKAVRDVFGLEQESLQSTRKGKEVSHPRMLAMWLARKYTRAALSEIGRYFGGRSHSTVISAQKKVDVWMSRGEALPTPTGDCRLEEALRRVEKALNA